MIDFNLFIILLLGELLILCQIVSRLGKINDNLGNLSNNIRFISDNDKKCYK